MTRLLNAAKIKRGGERQIEAALEAAQREIEFRKWEIEGHLRSLEQLMGRESVREWLKNYPELV